MLKYLILALLITSCATKQSSQKTLSMNNQSNMHHKRGRLIASGEMWLSFIKQFSHSAKMSEKAVEKSIIQYFKTKSPNNNHGNFVSVGISESQAKNIKTLSDEHPYMQKVQKWSMENMDKIFPNTERKVFAKIYDDVVISNRGGSNTYAELSSSRSALRQRQRQISPIKSISEKQEQILNSIKDLNSRSLASNYRENLSILQKRGKADPTIIANGQQIVESATLISSKTGLRAMGNGCKSFFKNASSEVLEVKANVDLARAESIEQMVASGKKVTEADLDNATTLAFRRVLGYTDDEATHALKRLKSKPCKLY